MPMLLIAESDGLNLRAAMDCSGETPIFTQPSKSAYCDSVWQYGIPLPEGLTPSCCSAVDAFISYNGHSEPMIYVHNPLLISRLRVGCDLAFFARTSSGLYYQRQPEVRGQRICEDTCDEGVCWPGSVPLVMTLRIADPATSVGWPHHFL